MKMNSSSFTAVTRRASGGELVATVVRGRARPSAQIGGSGLLPLGPLPFYSPARGACSCSPAAHSDYSHRERRRRQESTRRRRQRSPRSPRARRAGGRRDPRPDLRQRPARADGLRRLAPRRLARHRVRRTTRIHVAPRPRAVRRRCPTARRPGLASRSGDRNTISTLTSRQSSI